MSVAGEASAATTTMRQIGASVGIAVIGAVFAGAFMSMIISNIQADPALASTAKQNYISHLQDINIGSGNFGMNLPSDVKVDIDKAIVGAAKQTFLVSFFFILAGIILSLFIQGPKSMNESGPVHGTAE